MKKIVSFLFSIFLLSGFAFANSIIYEKPDVKIFVEGNQLQLEENVPIIVNSRTLVPLRKLLVGLGVPDNTQNIQWIGETRSVKVNYNEINIDLAIDSPVGYINGKKYTLDSAPIIYKDRTYLPARFVGEALGYTISWDQYTPAVIVTSNSNMEVITALLDELNSNMDSINSYETLIRKQTTETVNYNGEIETLESKVTELEEADLGKEIIYTQYQYDDANEVSFVFEYNTKDALYSCYKYEEDGILYNHGWAIYPYSDLVDESTPFDSKEKKGIIHIDKNLYGAVLLEEREDGYVVYTPSCQVDVLKGIGLTDLYEELTDGYYALKDFRLIVLLDKSTKLPKYLQILFSTDVSEMDDEGNSLYSQRKVNYEILFNKFNHYLELELPDIKN